MNNLFISFEFNRPDRTYDRVVHAISTLGDLYIKAGRIKEAVEHFVRIAANYLRGGSSKSAAYILNKALKLDAASPLVYRSLGELHLQDKEVARAHDDFIEAAAGFWREGNITAAIGMNQRALEVLPESRQAKAALAFIQHEIDQASAPPEPKIEVPGDLPAIIISIPDGSDAVCAPLTISESQLQAEKNLPGAIVNLPCGTPGLVLECFVESAQCDVRFHEAPVGQLER